MSELRTSVRAVIGVATPPSSLRKPFRPLGTVTAINRRRLTRSSSPHGVIAPMKDGSNAARG